jgi:ABC-type phosphate/phosphonate transport system substrate-binding protein
MSATTRTCILLAPLCLATSTCLAADAARAATPPEVVRIGAVAYAPSAVTIFNGLTRYLNKNGLTSDYVLYSNYDSLVAALARNEIDIAWNTPLAHAQYHVGNECRSQTLVMRDVDVDIHATIVVRDDSDIKSPADLAGKKLILGSNQAAEATVLPLHFLKSEGVALDKIELVSLDAEVDSKGNPCASPEHVLQALRAGRGDAGIITTGLWNREKNRPAAQGALRQVWTSPAFSHCVFTASDILDKSTAARFTKLMTAMDPKEPATADVMRLEGTRKWLPGSPKGFEDLVEALKTQSGSLTP